MICLSPLVVQVHYLNEWWIVNPAVNVRSSQSAIRTRIAGQVIHLELKSCFSELVVPNIGAEKSRQLGHGWCDRGFIKKETHAALPSPMGRRSVY